MAAQRKEEEAKLALLAAAAVRKASTSSSSSSESEAEHRNKLVRKASATYEQSTYNGDIYERSQNSSRSVTPGPHSNEDIFNREDASMKRLSLLEVISHFI